jgi:general secretion pathway protein D
MVADGFQFNLKVSPVITGKAATMKFDMDCKSLLGWNSDGSARRSNSEISTTVQLPYSNHEFVLGGIRKSESVRTNTGLPFVKDLPVIGRAFSTESESIKQSQLVVIASVEYSNPESFAGAEIRENLGKVVKGVNKGMNSTVGNMFFGQYGLDSARADRVKRLDDVGNKINDDFKTVK